MHERTGKFHTISPKTVKSKEESMSKTFTSRPGAVRPTGRGRGATNQTTQSNTNLGRGRGATSRSTTTTRMSSTPARSTMTTGQPAAGTYPNQRSGGEPSTSNDRVQHAGAYTVIAPNEDKRRKVREIAEKEEAQYENWKQQRRLGHVSYVGTVGGGLRTEPGARQQAQRSQATRTQRMMQQQERRDSLRQRENQQLDVKKAQARQRSDDNARREQDREARLREDMRRKNNAFLDRLEGKTH